MTQTTIESSLLIRPVARFVAIGLFLMAFFTTLWALWALYGLPLAVATVLVVIFVALAVIFVINGVQLIKSASSLPVPSGAESKRRGRALQLGFGITFAAEGVIIALVCALLGMSGAYAYFGPAIALVVGLHFIPFAFLFHRTIDFYIAGWVVTCAVIGIWLIAFRSVDPVLVGSLVAVATACGTAAYGIYMLRIKRAIVAALVEPEQGISRPG
jgi:hypothetical protein